MFRKFSFCLFFLFVFSGMTAQKNQLEMLVNEAKRDKNNPEIISKIEKLVTVSKDEKQNIEAYITLGKIYVYLEIYDKAHGFYMEALKLAKKNRLIDKMGMINQSLGSLQLQLENYEKSKQLYNTAIKYFQKTNNFEEIINVKATIAIIDIKTGNLERAIQTLVSIKNKKQVHKLAKSSVLFTLGNVYLQSSKPTIAIDYYLKSLSLIEASDTRRKIVIYLNLVGSYIALKQYDSAFFYNHKCEILLQKNHSDELRTNLYYFYAKINKAKFQYKEAYKNLELHHKFKERFDRSKAFVNTEKIEILNKIEKQKLDLKIKEQKIELLQNEKIAARIKILFLILLLAGIIILLFYLIKRQRNKVKSLSYTISQTENKLEFSQTKTDKMVLNIIKNNDFIERFKEDLKQIQTETNDSENKIKLNKLLFELHNFKLINDTKEDLFNEVDIQFSYNLEKKYPSLTEEERKICILIFLDLKNKDMAFILNSSVRSVENYRYRIRKKMNIDPEVTLLSVLSNL